MKIRTFPITNWLILAIIALFAILATVGVFYHLDVVKSLEAEKTALNEDLSVLEKTSNELGIEIFMAKLQTETCKEFLASYR